MISTKIFPILAVFLFSGICKAQEPTIAGYRGIWFTLGQFSTYGDKYSGGLGTYTSSHVPVAIYDKASHRTYFVYGGTTGEHDKHLLIMISYFDHATKKLPKPIIVLDKQGVDDPHDNASLSIDADGYIWVFVSGRNKSRPGHIFKSNEPLDISGFTEIYRGEITYPQPWYFGDEGFLLLYTKYTNGRELYWRKVQHSQIPGPEQKLAGMGGHYQLSHQSGNTLMTVFNYHPGGNVDKRTNLYFTKTDDMGESWKTVSGEILKPPLTEKNAQALIREYEQEGKLVYLNDLTVDKFGNPVILAVVSRNHQPGPDGDPREWIVFHYKGNRWSEHKVCTSTHNYDMGSLYVEGSIWRIIGPTEAGPQRYGTGGEMALWESRNEGQSWRQVKVLTSASERNHSYARRPLNAHDDFYAFWADGNADVFSVSNLFFCNKKGQVFKMPYTMKETFETPEKLKWSNKK